jgi:hypothetical protein
MMQKIEPIRPTKITSHAVDRYLERWLDGKLSWASCAAVLNHILVNAQFIEQEDQNQSIWDIDGMMIVVDNEGLVRTVLPKTAAPRTQTGKLNRARLGRYPL